MGYPNRFRRQADQLGSNGQFDYSAAGGTNGPSAIDAINSSMMQNAAEAKVMRNEAQMIRDEAQNAEDHAWRVANGEDARKYINKLNPNDNNFLDDFNKLDGRVNGLSGVQSQLGKLKDAYDKRIGKENDEWDTLLDDAKNYGTKDELDNLRSIRKNKGTIGEAFESVNGEDGFYQRQRNAKGIARDEAAYAKEEAKVNANYDRVTKVLTRTNKRKLDKRENLYKRQAKIKDMQNAAANDIEPNKARDQRLKAGLDDLTEELGELNKELKAYDDGMDDAEKAYNKFYNPPELDENGKEIPSRKNKVDGIFND